MVIVKGTFGVVQAVLCVLVILSLIFSGDAAKKKFKNLKTSYSNHLKRTKLASGAAAKKIRPYRWANQLAFLFDHMQERE